MTYVQTNALRRAKPSRAKIWYIVKLTCTHAAHKLTGLWREPRQSYPRLTDHLARDIGIDLSDLEWRQDTLPSRNTRHPML